MEYDALASAQRVLCEGIGFPLILSRGVEAPTVRVLPAKPRGGSSAIRQRLVTFLHAERAMQSLLPENSGLCQLSNGGFSTDFGGHKVEGDWLGRALVEIEEESKRHEAAK